jgi:hypothetical protein
MTAHQFLKDGFCTFPPGNVIKSGLAGCPFGASLFASDASIEAALQPVKLVEGICEGGREVRGRLAVQSLYLD